MRISGSRMRICSSRMGSSGSSPGCGGRVAPPLPGKAKRRPCGRSRPSHPYVSQHRRRDGQTEVTSQEQVQPGEQGQGKALEQSLSHPRAGTGTGPVPSQQGTVPPLVRARRGPGTVTDKGESSVNSLS